MESECPGTWSPPTPGEQNEQSRKNQRAVELTGSGKPNYKPIYRKHKPNAHLNGNAGMSVANHTQGRRRGFYTPQTKGGFGSPRRCDDWEFQNKQNGAQVQRNDFQLQKGSDQTPEKEPFSGPGFGYSNESPGSDSRQPIRERAGARRGNGSAPVSQRNRPFAGFGDPNSSGFGVPSEPNGRNMSPTQSRGGPRSRPPKLDHGAGLKLTAKQKECDRANSVNLKHPAKPTWSNQREGTQPLFTRGLSAQCRLPLLSPSPRSPLPPSHSPDPRAALRERLNPEQIDLLLKICDLVTELRLD